MAVVRRGNDEGAPLRPQLAVLGRAAGGVRGLAVLMPAVARSCACDTDAWGLVSAVSSLAALAAGVSRTGGCQ